METKGHYDLSELGIDLQSYNRFCNDFPELRGRTLPVFDITIPDRQIEEGKRVVAHGRGELSLVVSPTDSFTFPGGPAYTTLTTISAPSREYEGHQSFVTLGTGRVHKMTVQSLGRNQGHRITYCLRDVKPLP